MYGRPGSQQRWSSIDAKSTAVPRTLNDLDTSARHFAPPSRKTRVRNAAPGLADISEVAEWADESSCARAAVGGDDEFEELWADVTTATDQQLGVSVLDASSNDRAVASSKAAPEAMDVLRRYGGKGIETSSAWPSSGGRQSAPEKPQTLDDASEDAGNALSRPYRHVNLAENSDSASSEDTDDSDTEALKTKWADMVSGCPTQSTNPSESNHDPVKPCSSAGSTAKPRQLGEAHANAPLSEGIPTSVIVKSSIGGGKQGLVSNAAAAPNKAAIQKCTPTQHALIKRTDGASRTVDMLQRVVVEGSRDCSAAIRNKQTNAASSIRSLKGLQEMYRTGAGRDIGNDGGKEIPQVDSMEEEASLENEWDKVAAITDEMRQRASKDQGKIKSEDDIIIKPFSYNELDRFLMRLVAGQDEKENLDQRGSKSVEASAAKVDPVRPNQTVEDLVKLVSATHFDFNDTSHFRMLRTMYVKLSRNKSCPTIGSHWEVFGFQNTDPRMDLNRSGGVLNIVLMFYVFAKYFELIKAAFVLAQSVDQHFPLACVMINIAKILRDRYVFPPLSWDASGAFEKFCDMFAAAFHMFHLQWRCQKRTIRDAEQTFKEVQASLEETPQKLLDDLVTSEAARQEAHLKANASSNLDFTDLSLEESAGADSHNSLKTICNRLRTYQEESNADA